MALVFATVFLFPLCNLATGLPELGTPLLYGALAAVAEEFFFRGFVFTALKKKGRFWAAAVSSVAFAALHLLNLVSAPLDYTLLQVIGAFSVGFALCGLLWKTKKLWLCLVCHLLINLTGHTTLSSVGTCLTILCIFLYAGFGILLLRKNNEVLL